MTEDQKVLPLDCELLHRLLVGEVDIGAARRIAPQRNALHLVAIHNRDDLDGRLLNIDIPRPEWDAPLFHDHRGEGGILMDWVCHHDFADATEDHIAAG
jgi:hypothetical protein